MLRPTVLRNSAEPDIVIGIALKIFYQANDWIDNSIFLDRLDREYDAINKPRESRTGGQAVAKYKPALYYGLIDVREDGKRCINEYGRRYYEAYLKQDSDEMVDCLISSISHHQFGNNNPAVPDSHSKIEPPKVFLVSCLLLNNILSKTEYAYILENLAKDRDYRKILVDVSLARIKESELAISEYAKNNYRDDKGLKFLSDAGLFDEGRGTKSIKKEYIIKYSDLLSSLSIISEEKGLGMPAQSTPVQMSDEFLHFPYLSAIRTKPFLLLAGISGTGKSRIVRELAFKSCPKYLQDKDGTTPGNYCMIEVKPNWHDSTELLGYYSNMNKSYQFKKFVKFLVKAKMFPKVPFFVCLDEMNLAPVEHYFAEMLSIMETRKHPKIEGTDEVDKEVIKTGAIVDAQHFREFAGLTDKNGNIYTMLKTDRDIYMKLHGLDTENDIDEEIGKRTDLTTEGLTLPDNVIIIGTVNMDDTTHQFSRKVIDRAMTIEMNGGRLSDMFGGSKDLEYLPQEEQEKWQDCFRQRYVTADEVLEEHPEAADDIVKIVPEKLENINKALKGTPFEVSYRVLNELTIMVGVLLDSKKEGETLDDIINQALDRILLMKILPRIEGDSDMFNLSRDFKQENHVEYNNRLEWLMELAPEIVAEEQEGEEHRQTAREKIKEMKERLENQEFTRFWP
jgi:hypothetical protein